MEKVKEAIEFLERLKDSLMIGQMVNIITLLKRGEKYETMWEIFKKYLYSYEGDAVHRMNYKDKIHQIEQKYFPKE